MLGAVLFDHQGMQVAIDAINELVAEAGKPKWDWQPAEENAALKEALAKDFEAKVGEAYRITDKMARQDALSAAKDTAIEALAGEEEGTFDAEEVAKAFAALEKRVVR